MLGQVDRPHPTFAQPANHPVAIRDELRNERVFAQRGTLTDSHACCSTLPRTPVQWSSGPHG